MCYTYNSLSRVTKRVVKDFSDVVLNEEDYSYDAAGNITDAPDCCFVYDTNNRLTVFDGSPVTYDLDGNMLSNGCTCFEYDSSNRLVKACDHTYTYNAEDIRIRNLCGNEDTAYTYDTNSKLSQLLEKTTNGVVTKYVYGLGLIGEECEGAFKTYHFDSRGSTVAITDIGGNVTDTFKYDTYGNEIEHIGNSSVIFGYNGRDGVVTDKNGLIYMRARYYSPDMRRFVNADILHGAISDSTSLNRYSYVNGNPVSFVDPFGLVKDEDRGQGPTALEAAYMAKHSYDAKTSDAFRYLGQNFGGWRLIDIYENNQGLKICVYFNIKDSSNGYAVVSAGSELDLFNKFSDTFNDWILNNFTQPLGYSKDMWDSISYANKFAKDHDDHKITFIGHSKGGAEAIANAVTTNNNAIVFNPATAFLNKYNLPTNNYTGNITSYVIDGKPLDSLSAVLGKNIGTEVTLTSKRDYDAPIIEWDSEHLGAQEPSAQFGQLVGNSIANLLYNAYGVIQKHSMDIMIETLQ